MLEDYDRERCAALMREAREMTDQLKTETKSIERLMAGILSGGEDEPSGACETLPRASIVEEPAIASKSVWQFWR